MPRTARLELPGIPMHVTQRGVNRCAIFLDDQDRHHYRRVLHDACCKHGVAIHAYVLMDNHVHLLLGATHGGSVSLAMRLSGQRHVQAFNLRHGRTGPLWQGRFKSSLVDSEAYLLAVIRYIELNPVRAAMVARPEDHRWSSVHTHLADARDPLVTPHPLYLALGVDPGDRARAYREWLYGGIAQADTERIRRHLAQERVLGSPRFHALVARALGRPTVARPRGRPWVKTP
jgi:putative transposase